MSQTATSTKNLTIGNRSYSTTSYPAGNNILTVSIDLPAATAGTLTTRSTSSSGIITSAGHGLTTADKPDVYWNTTADGAGCRTQVTISAVTTDTFTFSSGSGDTLPTAASSLTWQVARITDVSDLVGNTVTALAADAGVNGGTVYFLEGGAGTSATETTLVSKGTAPSVYTYDGTGTNPLAGKTITAFQASQGGLSATTAYVSVLQQV